MDLFTSLKSYIIKRQPERRNEWHDLFLKFESLEEPEEEPEETKEEPIETKEEPEQTREEPEEFKKVYEETEDTGMADIDQTLNESKDSSEIKCVKRHRGKNKHYVCYRPHMTRKRQTSNSSVMIKQDPVGLRKPGRPRKNSNGNMNKFTHLGTESPQLDLDIIKIKEGEIDEAFSIHRPSLKNNIINKDDNILQVDNKIEVKSTGTPNKLQNIPRKRGRPCLNTNIQVQKSAVNSKAKIQPTSEPSNSPEDLLSKPYHCLDSFRFAKRLKTLSNTTTDCLNWPQQCTENTLEEIKDTIENRLGSKLGEMLRKRHLSRILHDYNNYRFWHTSIKEELFKLSKMITLVDLRKYMVYYVTEKFSN